MSTTSNRAPGVGDPAPDFTLRGIGLKEVSLHDLRGKNVVILETATNKQLASVEVGERPWGIAVSPDGNTVFTANGPSNDVSIVDVASRTVKAKVTVGDRPWGVVFVP